MAGEVSSTSEQLIAIKAELQNLGVTAGRDYLAYLRLKSLQEQQSPLRIGNDSFVPMALSTETERNATGIVRLSYTRDILPNPEYAHADPQMPVIITDMDAGIGTSISRRKYVADHFNGRAQGSKGTDILISAPGYSRPLSVTEIKLLHYYTQAARGVFGDITIEPLLNFESVDAYQQLLGMETVTERRDGTHPTLQQLLNDDNLHIRLTDPLMQPHFPTIDEKTQAFRDKPQAPGGHGYLANLLLDRLARQPLSEGTKQARVISNGDGINNTAPDRAITCVEHIHAGIAILTTPRTKSDKKVGLFGIRNTPQGPSVDIMEVAQAQKAGQEELFGQVGLPDMTPAVEAQVAAMGRVNTPDEQDTNTNTMILNDGLLSKFLSQLQTNMGPEKFAQLITPDPILNPKEFEGEKINQLEGAMGSVILNLARYVNTNPEAQALWRSVSNGGPFLCFISLDADKVHKVYSRELHFSSIKASFDAIVQDSDRYRLNTTDWFIEDLRPGHAIKAFFEFTDAKQLELMEEAFENTSLIDLDEIAMTGQKLVSVANMKLKGRVIIHNNFAGTGDLSIILHTLPIENGKPVLENVEITIGENGEIETKQIA